MYKRQILQFSIFNMLVLEVGKVNNIEYCDLGIAIFVTKKVGVE